MKNTDDVVIKKSKIGQFDNGKGVFANRNFKKGEIVIQYHLKALTKEGFEKLPPEEKQFTHKHWERIYLYSIPERYVNHSSDPNTAQDLKNKCDVAKRDIRNGEEITTDATKDDIEEQRQSTKEKAVLLALQKEMALIRRDLEIHGMKNDGSTIFISKSKDYDSLWRDALNELRRDKSDSQLHKIILKSKVIVHKGRFAYLKGNATMINGHFFVARDKDETTIVTEEKNLKTVNYEKDVKWFKLFEIRVSAPFVAKGFLAKVTKTIADNDLNVLVVSTFSKDYILVREETWKTAIKALEEVGFPIVKE